MDIDQARGDQVVLQVNYPDTITSMEVGPNRCDLTVLNQDITFNQLFTDQPSTVLQ